MPDDTPEITDTKPSPAFVNRAGSGASSLWLALGLLICAINAQAEPVRASYSRVQLVAEHATLPANGGEVTIGLHIEPDPGWHVYWLNPGDAGLPATMRWDLPVGFSASEFQFPAPHVIPFGELITYGFDAPVLLLGELTVPSGLAAGESVALSGRARWVVCDDELCVPERSSLSLTLPVGKRVTDPNQADRFAAARAKLPESVDWSAHFELLEDSTRPAGETPQSAFGVARRTQAQRVLVTVATPQPAKDLHHPYLFVATRHLVEYGRQTATATKNNLVFAMDAGNRAAQATDFKAVLTYADGAGTTQAAQLHVESLNGSNAHAKSDTATLPRETPPTHSTQAASIPPTPSANTMQTPPPWNAQAASTPLSAHTGMSLAMASLFAFIGGILLNLMPCVFPVLSIKALSLVSTAHANQRLARLSGLLYTIGILIAFALIGVVLMSLRGAGQAAGWGFQLQSPIVNLGLALLMLAIALNLLGVYEFGARAAGIGQSLGQGDERKSAFFTGLLAVVVATPCTAPFMAGALGYALVQPAFVALGIFMALGLGLAFPYLLVSFVPAFGRMLPRPGAWMARFRSTLAFPMFATSLWLLWIMGKQLGVDSMAMGLLAALLFALALWAYGQIHGSQRRWAWGGLAVGALIATLTAGAAIERYKAEPAKPANGPVGMLGQLELERFTPERLADYVDTGQPTFAYFTADWCVNCKLNERVALASDAVGRAFRERGIKVLVGDWTNEDPTISEWLGRYGRAGVPLYLYFPAGSTLGDARVLPQVLIPEMVVDAIKQADHGTDDWNAPD